MKEDFSSFVIATIENYSKIHIKCFKGSHGKLNGNLKLYLNILVLCIYLRVVITIIKKFNKSISQSSLLLNRQRSFKTKLPNLYSINAKGGRALSF